MTFSEFTLDDTGTRFKHYTELIDLWQSTIDYLNGRHLLSEPDKRKKEMLEAGVYLLQKQIDVMCDYTYNVWKIRPAIDTINYMDWENLT